MATVQMPDPFAQVPSLGPERPVVWPARTRRKLANGLEVVLVESHTIPKFTGELYFRSGNAAAAPQRRRVSRKSRLQWFARALKSDPAAKSKRICGASARMSAQAQVQTPAPSGLTV